jgi:hypothetical protein
MGSVTPLQGFERDLHELLDDFVHQVSVLSKLHHALHCELPPACTLADLAAAATRTTALRIDAGGRRWPAAIAGGVQNHLAAASCVIHPSGGC